MSEELIVVVREPIEIVVCENSGGETEILQIIEERCEVIETVRQGDSNYDIAVQEGFSGTKAEWLASLQNTAASGFVQIPFAFNNISPRIVHTLPSAMIIISATLAVKTAFNGVGATLKVGTAQNPELLIAESDNLPSFAANFGVEMSESFDAGTQIIITTNPGAGASAGAGNLILEAVKI